jgi:hypothetical protein
MGEQEQSAQEKNSYLFRCHVFVFSADIYRVGTFVSREAPGNFHHS